MKKFPTEKQKEFILGLAEETVNLIGLIENPRGEYIELEILSKLEINNLITNEDVNYLIMKLRTINCQLHKLYQSSKHKDIESFRHLTTDDVFLSRGSRLDPYKNFKSDYEYILKFLDITSYEVLEKIILDNIKKHS